MIADYLLNPDIGVYEVTVLTQISSNILASAPLRQIEINMSSYWYNNIALMITVQEHIFAKKPCI